MTVFMQAVRDVFGMPPVGFENLEYEAAVLLFLMVLVAFFYIVKKVIR
jgi:hypothetical protein